MKTTYKKLINFSTFIIGLTFLVTSCDQDLIEVKNESVTSKNKKTEQAQKFIDPVTGLPEMVGYGHDIKTGVNYQIPFDKPQMITFTGDSEVPNSVYSRYVKNKSELIKEFSKGVSVNANGNIFNVLKVKANFEQSFSGYESDYSESIEFLGIIQSASEREQILGLPPFNEVAQELLDTDLQKFILNYGLGYVQDNSVGFRNYYLYSFKFDSSKGFTREQTQAAIDLNLKSIFSLSGQYYGTEEQKTLFESLERSIYHESNIDLYVTNPVNTHKELLEERLKIGDYIMTNPDKAESLGIKVNPYYDSNHDFASKFEELQECYSNFDAWAELYNEINDIKINTISAVLFQECTEALDDITEEMDKARRCNGSTYPSPDFYDDIKTDFIKETPVNIYSYYNRGNGDHYYNVYLDYVRNYVREGVAFKALKNKIDSSLAIYSYYNSRNGDHYYTNYSGYVRNYVREGIAFYSLKSNVKGTVPVYSYYNRRNGDHYYTKYNGSINGYDKEGVAFYAF